MGCPVAAIVIETVGRGSDNEAVAASGSTAPGGPGTTAMVFRTCVRCKDFVDISWMSEETFSEGCPLGRCQRRQ